MHALALLQEGGGGRHQAGVREDTVGGGRGERGCEENGSGQDGDEEDSGTRELRISLTVLKKLILSV